MIQLIRSLPPICEGLMKQAILVLTLLWLPVQASFAQGGGRDTGEVSREAQLTIERGLDFLARTQTIQTLDDGSLYGYWLCDIGYKLNYSYQITKTEGRHVGVTALACIAFLASGNLPGRGKYGRNVEAGLNYILSKVKDTGFITDEGAKGTRMYSHAFATLFLAEVYGMTYRQDVRSKLKRAIDGIIKWQNGQGGWRYLPLASDADLSVTVTQLQALRAARNAGIQVNTATIEKAIRYVVRCASADGAFKYQDLALSRDSFALTAAGLTSLFCAGIYDDESQMLQQAISEQPGKNLPRMVSSGLEYLQEKRNTVQRRTYFYFYGHYYSAQAMYIAGGKYWENWYPMMRDELINLQNTDGEEAGSWDCQVGQPFGTAMACIILQIPYGYLPILQR